MMISYRQVMLKKASEPNKYPCNASNESRDADKGNPQKTPALQTIVNLKMDPERKRLDPKIEQYQNWEMLNQLGTTPGAPNIKNPKPHNEAQAKESTDVII